MLTPLLAALAVASVGLVGCGKKGAALDELKKVEDACAAKDKSGALDIALKASDSNSAFKSAFNGVFESVADKKHANVCGGLSLSELRLRLEN